MFANSHQLIIINQHISENLITF